MIKFHDPEKYLKQATKIQYFWFIDDVAYGQTNQVLCAALYIRDEETNFKKNPRIRIWLSWKKMYPDLAPD